MTAPWYPHRPIWDELHAPAIAEHWEERAAIMEYLGGYSRGAAELFSYALLVDELAGDVRPVERSVDVQIDRARRIRHHWSYSQSIGVYA